MRRREALLVPALALAQTTAPAFTLPKLPYALDALEPHIDARTMEIHHARHHQTYVDNLNKAISTATSFAGKPLERLLSDLNALPHAVRSAVRNNGGGHANHSLFWQVLGTGKGEPKGELAAAIRKSFGSQTKLEESLRAAGLSVFGSGWVWLMADKKDQLKIETSPNQDSPWMSGRQPLAGIDVWEHAYYLRYQNQRADYLAAVLKVINWEFVSQRYQEVRG